MATDCKYATVKDNACRGFLQSPVTCSHWSAKNLNKKEHKFSEHSSRYWILGAWLPFFVLNIVGEEFTWRGVALPRQEAAFGGSGLAGGDPPEVPVPPPLPVS